MHYLEMTEPVCRRLTLDDACILLMRAYDTQQAVHRCQVPLLLLEKNYNNSTVELIDNKNNNEN